jgi:uncharacterized membrane protein
MNTVRLEALSDGVFAVVLVLLASTLSIPEIFSPTDAKLLQALENVPPLLVSYGASVAVLTMFWMSHTMFYSACNTKVTRVLVLLNILFLSLVALMPFSTHLLGSYPALPVAVLIYGMNVFALGLVDAIVLQYAYVSDDIDTTQVSRHLLTQARIYSLLVPVCSLAGMALIGVSVWASLALYVFPVVFIIAPGILRRGIRRFGFALE